MKLAISDVLTRPGWALCRRLRGVWERNHQDREVLVADDTV